MSWWNNGMAQVISYAVTVKRRGVAFNECLNMLLDIFQSLMKWYHLTVCT
jgi:hypothetical protein